MSDLTIGLVGNPNCGKTRLFNALTGLRQKVGNWPGVTVERKVGAFEEQGTQVEVVDLPGIYSLDAASGGSLDEVIARQFALSGDADLFVNIVDASNLERNLYLTTQLVEMGVPVVLAVNMLDLAQEAGIELDPKQLEKALGCPVVPMVATREEGVDVLKQRIVALSNGGALPTSSMTYAPEIETALNTLEPMLTSAAAQEGIEPRWMAVKLLENDQRVMQSITATIQTQVENLQEQVEQKSGEEADVLIADARYTFAHEVIERSVRRQGEVKRSLTERIDRVVLNRFLGIPIFLAVMYLLFVLSFNGGNVFLNFFSGVTHTFFVQGVGHLLSVIGSPQWLISLLANSVGGALELVSTFIAPIGMTFLFLSVLEDSGYMARATFVMDRFMRRLGLPGKAFVPMIVGFGCNVPAVMATRTLEDPRERLVSAMMQPFMSCSARLVIYMAFVTVFFRHDGGQIVFALYMLGIVAAIMTAFLLKRTALKGEATPFVMEMPAYHVPTIRGILRSTWARLSVFLKRVGKVIIVASVIVSVLSSFSPTGKPLDSSGVNHSALAFVGKSITPVFQPMGITQQNWPATVGLLSGVVVKEIVMGTLNGVYSKMGNSGAVSQQSKTGSRPWHVVSDLDAAVQTIPRNAKRFVSGLADPLGFGQVGRAEQKSLQKASKQQGLATSTLTRMGALFSVPAAMAYLIFVLLYIPCVNTMGAIYRETGSRAWTVFAIAWGLELAYGLAVLYYQFATFGAHPASTVGWSAAIFVVFSLTVAMLRLNGQRRDEALASF